MLRLEARVKHIVLAVCKQQGAHRQMQRATVTRSSLQNILSYRWQWVAQRSTGVIIVCPVKRTNNESGATTLLAV
jgi:hypothetical protein